MLEATALPTEPQPLPNIYLKVMSDQVPTYLEASGTRFVETMRSLIYSYILNLKNNLKDKTN